MKNIKGNVKKRPKAIGLWTIFRNVLLKIDKTINFSNLVY